MDGGEQRVFKIDLNGKPYCLLNHEDITISKKDWKPTLDKSTFQVLGFERIAFMRGWKVTADADDHFV